MENNLGSLSYSLNIDLDKDVVAKIEKQLANIDLVNKVGISVDSKHLVEEIQKALSGQGFKIKLDVEGLEDAKAKLAGGQAGLSGEKQVYEDILRLIQESNLASNEKAEQIAIEQIELAKLKVAREQLNTAEKGGTLSTQDAIRLKGQIIEKETQHKATLAGLNSELRNEVKTNMAASNSMDELSQKVARLKSEYRGLSEQARNSSVGTTMLKDIQTMDSKIKVLDASIGNYQRNVGDYASGMYGLTYSIQQVARELPNIAISPQMFIMAISNNLPILQDELRRASAAYKALNEQHKIGLNLNQKAVPVWKQITSSIFSWQTVLVAAITVGTVFGKQIFEWIGGLMQFKDAVGLTRSELKKLTEDLSKSMGSEFGKMNQLFDALKSAKAGTDEYNEAKRKIISDYGSYLTGLDNEITSLKNVEGAYRAITDSIIEMSKQKALSAVYEEQFTEAEKVVNEQLPKIREQLVGRWGEDIGQFYYEQVQTALKNGEKLSFGMQRIVDDFTVKTPTTVGSSITGFTQTAIIESNNLQKSINEITDAQKRANLKISEAKKLFDNLLPDSTINNFSLLKKYEDELAMAKLMPTDTEENIAKRNAEIERIELQIKTLNELGKTQKAQEKYVNTEKQDTERIRNVRDLEYAAEQARIDAMEDGSTKTLAQLDLNHKREMDMLDRQKEDKIQKIKDNARAIFNADPKNKGKKFDDSGIGLSSEEEAGYASLRERTTERQGVEKNKPYLDLIKKYQDYTTKRLEIERKFNEDIKLLESKRTEDNSAQTDKAITQRTKERDEDFSSSLMDEFKESDDWIKMFEDLDRLSDETISNLIARFEEFKESEGKNLAPTELKELTKSIEKLRDESSKNDLSGQLAESSKEYRYYSKVVEAQKQILEQKKKEKATTEEIKIAEDNLLKSQDKRASSLKDVNTAVNNIGAKGSALVNLGNDVVGMLENFGVNVSDGVKNTLSGLGEMMGGLESIDITKPFTAVTGTIKTIIGLGNTVAGIFGFGKSDKSENDTKRLENITSKIESLNEAINKQLEKRVELIEEATAAEAKYLDTINQQNIEQQKNYILQQLELLSGTEIFGLKGKNNDLDLNELMSMMGLDTMQEFIDWWNNGGELELLAKGYSVTNKESWQSIIDSYNDLTDAAEESAEASQEAITGISFDSLKDSLDDLITSVDTTFSDIEDSFEEHMSDAILNFIKSSYLTDALQEWYNQFSEAYSDDVLSESEVEALRTMYDEAYNKAQSMYDDAIAVAGIDKSSSEDSALSQAIQGIQESNPGLIEAYLNTIRDGVISGRITGENTLSVLQVSQHIQSQSLSELQAINSNTLAMVNAFKSVMANSSSDNGTGLRVYVK